MQRPRLRSKRAVALLGEGSVIYAKYFFSSASTLPCVS